MMPLSWRLLLILSLAIMPVVTAAQDLTHPLDMDLPESNFQRPDPVDFQTTLENGLIAFVAEARQVPLVTMSAFVRVGKVDDAQPGAAEALLEALRVSGPTGLSATEFRSALKHMTATYTVEMHDEWTEISLNVPTEDLAEAMSIFAGLIRSPDLSQANIDSAAARLGPTANDLGGEAGPALYEGSLDAAVERFYDVVYAGHPYGAQPDEADYANLTVADVADFHAAYFVPGNMTVSIAGDIDTYFIHGSLDELFGDWPGRDVPSAPELPAVRTAKSAQHHFPAEKLQSWLVFGHDLPQVPLADQAALEVMNYILAGGHLWTRMTVETRYKYGYTNDASGFLEPKWLGPGSYNFRSYSRPEVIEAIFDNMLEEIYRIQGEAVSDEEMFVAKGALADGSFQIRYLDGYAIARSFALERLRYDNHDRSASYVRRVRAVTADDVLQAARKYLRPDDMQVILIGRPQELLR